MPEDQDLEQDNLETEETTPEATPQSSWYDTLDPDLKEHPSITKFKDPGSLAKSYVELQKLIGKEKIVVPTEKSTKEEWDAFYSKVGRPESATDYAVPELELPEEIKMRGEHLEAFRAKAHELGISKKAFAELYGFEAGLRQQAYNQQLENVAKMKSESETSLRGEWGAAYEKKVDSAQKLIHNFFGGKELNPAFKVLANDKGFIKAMVEIAEKVGEDNIAGSPRLTLTPKEATSQMNAMLGDFKHPYHNNLHPEHNAAVERFIELARMAESGR